MANSDFLLKVGLDIDSSVDNIITQDIPALERELIKRGRILLNAGLDVDASADAIVRSDISAINKKIDKSDALKLKAQLDIKDSSNSISQKDISNLSKKLEEQKVGINTTLQINPNTIQDEIAKLSSEIPAIPVKVTLDKTLLQEELNNLAETLSLNLSNIKFNNSINVQQAEASAPTPIGQDSSSVPTADTSYISFDIKEKIEQIPDLLEKIQRQSDILTGKAKKQIDSIIDTVKESIDLLDKPSIRNGILKDLQEAERIIDEVASHNYGDMEIPDLMSSYEEIVNDLKSVDKETTNLSQHFEKMRQQISEIDSGDNGLTVLSDSQVKLVEQAKRELDSYAEIQEKILNSQTLMNGLSNFKGDGKQSLLDELNSIFNEILKFDNIDILSSDDTVKHLELIDKKFEELKYHISIANDQNLKNTNVKNLLKLYDDLSTKIKKSGKEEVQIFAEAIEIQNKLSATFSNASFDMPFDEDQIKLFHEAESYWLKLNNLPKKEKGYNTYLLSLQSKIKQLTLDLKKMGVEISDTPIDELGKELEEISKNYNKPIDILTDDEQEQLNEFVKELEEFSIEVKDIKKNVGQDFFDVSMLRRFNDVTNKLKSFVAEYPKILSNPKFKSEYDKISKIEFSDMQTPKKDIEDLTNRVNKFIESAKQSGLAVHTFGKRFKIMMQNFTGISLVTGALYEVKSIFQDMIRNVISLDTAMTELKKVTNESSESYRNFFETAKSQSKEVGATISDTITATADFARLGYGLADATSLAKAATIYKSVGDGIDSISSASESIISTMKAFNIEADDALDIVDKFNAVGNTSPISSAGLGEALQRSASALHTANNTLEESIGLITAANAVTQDPEVVGTAMKTLALRVRGAKTELEDAGLSIEGMAGSVSELRSKMLGLAGVDIMIDDTTFKSTYQVMGEIADKWNELNDISKANILELLGGKRQSNVLASLIENFDLAEQAVATSMNSIGSATAENEKQLDSIQGKITMFKSSFESLSATVVNSNLIKTIVDGGTKIIDILDKIVSFSGSISPIVGMVASIGSAKFFKNSDLKEGLSGMLDAFKEFKDIELTFNNKKKIRLLQDKERVQLTKDIRLLNDFWKSKNGQGGSRTPEAANILKADMSKDAQELVSFLEKANKGYGDGLKKIEDYNKSKKDSIELIRAETVATKALTVAKTALKAATVGLIASLVTTALIKFGKVIWDNVLTTNALTEKLEELEAKTKSVGDNANEFSELASRFDELRQQTQRTNVEEKEFYDIQNKLKELYPELNGYYDENNNFIVDATSNIKSLTAAYEEYYCTLRTDTLETYFKDPIGFWKVSQYETDKNVYNGAKQRKEDIIKMENSGSFDYLDDSGALTEDFNKAEQQIEEAEKALREHVKMALMNSADWEKLGKAEKEAFLKAIGDITGDDLINILDNFEVDPDGIIDKIRNDFNAKIQGILTETTANTILIPLSFEESQEEIVENVNVIQTAIDSVGGAFSELRDDGKLTAKTISSLSEVFGSCGQTWEDFLTLVGSGDMTVDSLSNSLNDLITAYIQEKGLLGGVTEETKGLLVEMLKSIGVTNAEEVATYALTQEFARLQAVKIAQTNTSLSDLSEDEAGKLEILKNVSQDVIKELYKLYYAKLTASTDSFASATDKEIDKLKQLAIAAGVASENISTFDRIKEASQRLNYLNKLTYLNTSESSEKASLEKEIADLQNKLLAEQNGWSQKVTVDVDYSQVAPATGQIKSEFERMYDELEYMREMNLISEEQYLYELYKLNEQFNKDNLELYRKYQIKIFDMMKDLLRKQINAQADAEIKALRKKRKETEEYYDKLIDAEKEKLKKLKEEWQQQDMLLKIEQARAALAKAQSQKTVNVYEEGKGFVWKPDESAIQDAQSNLDQAIKDYERYLEELAIQERIDQLEKAKEEALKIIDEQIEKVEEWRDNALEAVDDMQFGLEEFLEFLEEWGINITEELEKLIEALTEFVSEWNSEISKMKAPDPFAGGGGGGGVVPSAPSSAPRPSNDARDEMYDRPPHYEYPNNSNAGRYDPNKGYQHPSMSGGSGDVGLQHRLENQEKPKFPYKPPEPETLSLRRHKYDMLAKGTLKAPYTGWYRTDEEGAELKIPGKGTFTKLTYGSAVLPADVSKNLWEIGKNPLKFVKAIADMAAAKRCANASQPIQMNFGDISLPNVTNAESFASELKNFANKAQQWVYTK